MKIIVASKNQVKVDAVKEVISQYQFLANAEISSAAVASGVSEQPKSLEEMVRGAINRAISSFEYCNYSFGIESGLMEVPYTKTGLMDTCACVIYDGKETHIGLSCAFECPESIMQTVLQEGCDLNHAFLKAGLTSNPKLGNADGAIGLLTKGRVTRKDYTKQAVMMALIHLENDELYKQ
ncbi:MAG: inosine/xanthosine triphosphatase [Candidatus Aenigmarchaeota archaeon]|nr:inosine/xanthosine triphosphatase [Candidatus Aenigmarchaeota archaeon]